MAIETLYSKEMAEWYDEMYCDEETTQKQIKFLNKIFKKHNIKSVLDIACGTGRHALELKKLGYDVAGLDLEPGMIAYAKKLAKSENLKIDFRVQDMRNIKLNKKFDAAIIFFTAFAYMDSNDDVINALKSVNKHLKKNGILIIETFFGWPKVVSGKFKTNVVDKMKKDNMTYEVTDENSLDTTNNYVYAKRTHIRKIGSKKLKTLKDKRPTKLRLYFPNELDLFFRLSGFKTIDFFGDVDGHKLSENHNNRLVSIAKKV